jgi:hypothetical protein
MRRSEEWWDMLAPPTAVRCEGHVQNGSRCLRPAVLGATVCSQHGGSAPQVRQRAAARIGNAADEMVKRLQAMLDDPAVEARDKIKIAQDLLDRAGLNATEKHIVGVGQVDPVEALFRNLLSDPSNLGPAQVEPSQPSAQALAWNREVLDGDDVVEGEIVEEQPAPDDTPTETMSSRPPRHIRDAMERLI